MPKLIDLIPKILQETTKTLEINNGKTLISTFVNINGDISSYSSTINDSGKLIKSDKTFEYLGLSYNGKRICLRPSTISGFMKKLCNTIEREVKSAKEYLEKKDVNIDPDRLYSSVNFNLIRQCSHKIKISNPLDSSLKRNFYDYLLLAKKITQDDQIDNFHRRIRLKKMVRKYCQLSLGEQYHC